MAVMLRAYLESLRMRNYSEQTVGKHRRQFGDFIPWAADRGVMTIRQGKGKKDRVVPIGARALAWAEKYRHEVTHPARMTREPGREQGGM